MALRAVGTGRCAGQRPDCQFLFCFFTCRTTCTTVYIHVDGPSPKVVVVPETAVGVGVGASGGPAGGVSANEPVASGSAPPNVACSHAN